MDLVFDGTNFVLPSRNIDQLLQIDVKYVFDSTCSLITIFILKKMIFLFTYNENIKSIYYSPKTINFFKNKKRCFKTWCTNWYTLKKMHTWKVHYVLKQPKQKQLTRVNSIEKFLKSKVIWWNTNSPFCLNITCSINTILNPYKHNLSIRFIFISRTPQ